MSDPTQATVPPASTSLAPSDTLTTLKPSSSSAAPIEPTTETTSKGPSDTSKLEVGGGGGGGPVIIDKVPEDQVNLRLLLVSGKKSDILVSGSDTVATVKVKIFEQWPKGKKEDCVGIFEVFLFVCCCSLWSYLGVEVM
jgi:hypothetical protein